jgi:hypothetical protein
MRIVFLTVAPEVTTATARPGEIGGELKPPAAIGTDDGIADLGAQREIDEPDILARSVDVVTHGARGVLVNHMFIVRKTPGASQQA